MRHHHLLLALPLLLILGLVGCLVDSERPATEPGNSGATIPNGNSREINCVGSCRVTGGGVDANGNWNGQFDTGTNERDRYQFGGQAGANTALPPEPKGEWTHHQQRGGSGSFVFHAGTASAPEGTRIDWIGCGDPGFCNPARPAPAKQIDFGGIGMFKNMKNVPAIIADNVIVGVSLHRFEVNIDDAGEPGRSGKMDVSGCPDQGFGALGVGPVDCDCPDFYRITIYADYTETTVIYQVYGYIKGGNLQIHPLTGFDTP